MHQIRFRLELRPRPHWGAYSTPRSPIWWVGGWLSPPKKPTPALDLKTDDLYGEIPTFLQLMTVHSSINVPVHCLILSTRVFLDTLFFIFRQHINHMMLTDYLLQCC